MYSPVWGTISFIFCSSVASIFVILFLGLKSLLYRKLLSVKVVKTAIISVYYIEFKSDDMLLKSQ